MKPLSISSISLLLLMVFAVVQVWAKLDFDRDFYDEGRKYFHGKQYKERDYDSKRDSILMRALKDIDIDPRRASDIVRELDIDPNIRIPKSHLEEMRIGQLVTLFGYVVLRVLKNCQEHQECKRYPIKYLLDDGGDPESSGDIYKGKGITPRKLVTDMIYTPVPSKLNFFQRIVQKMIKNNDEKCFNDCKCKILDQFDRHEEMLYKFKSESENSKE